MLKNSEGKIELLNGSFRVSGQLNFMTVMVVWHQSLPLLTQCKTLNFDFSGVSQANSSALALLLEWLKYAKKHQKPIAFSQIPAQLKSIAQAADISHLIGYN